MVISKYLKALVHELQRLYKQLALAQLHKRMQSYHSRHINHSHATDIKLTLSEYIDNVINNHEGVASSVETSHPERAFADCPGLHKAGAKQSHRPSPYKAAIDDSHPLDKNSIGELSKYFKHRIHDAELHPAIKDKLKRSVWEHINAATQCALRGDRRNAKMHVEIASYAFKEIAHYMSEDQYRAFTVKLDEHLSALSTD